MIIVAPLQHHITVITKAKLSFYFFLSFFLFVYGSPVRPGATPKLGHWTTIVPLKQRVPYTRVGRCVGTSAISRYFRERSHYRDTRNVGRAGSRACSANYNVIAAINEQFQGASVHCSVAGDINSKRIT